MPHKKFNLWWSRCCLSPSFVSAFYCQPRRFQFGWPLSLHPLAIPLGVPSWSLVFAFFANVGRKSSSDFYLALTRIISLISSPICKVVRSHFRRHVICGSAALADRSAIRSSCNGLALITLSGCMSTMCLHIRLFIILYYSAISRKYGISPFPFKLLLSSLQK